MMGGGEYLEKNIYQLIFFVKIIVCIYIIMPQQNKIALTGPFQQVSITNLRKVNATEQNTVACFCGLFFVRDESCLRYVVWVVVCVSEFRLFRSNIQPSVFYGFFCSVFPWLSYSSVFVYPFLVCSVFEC